MAIHSRTGSAAAGTGGTSEYEPPILRFHGSVGQQTAAQHAGVQTDAAFPAGTPLASLTFS